TVSPIPGVCICSSWPGMASDFKGTLICGPMGVFGLGGIAAEGGSEPSFIVSPVGMLSSIKLSFQEAGGGFATAGHSFTKFHCYWNFDWQRSAQTCGTSVASLVRISIAP